MLKFAVVGCGNLALRYSIPAIMNCSDSELVVCINRSTKPKKKIENQYKVPFETSFKKALEKYEFNAVYISTPNAAHAETVFLAAKNKKHILCEKSLGVNLKEVQEMVEFCKENNVALFEGFMYQFHSQHKFVKKLIQEGEIGTPFHFLASFGFPPINENDFRYKKELGGGVILDAGSYNVHSARQFFGREPISSHAIIENEGHEVDIRGTVLMNFGESKTASLIFGFNNMYQSKYTIWGTKGMITLNRAYALPPDFKPTCIIEKQGQKKEFVLEPCNHFIEEIKYFNGGYKNEETKKEWYDEALKQSKALQGLANSKINM